MALEGVTVHAIPWLGKKAVEMGRYGASKLMRNKKLQKKKQQTLLITVNLLLKMLFSNA